MRPALAALLEPARDLSNDALRWWHPARFEKLVLFVVMRKRLSMHGSHRNPRAYHLHGNTFWPKGCFDLRETSSCSSHPAFAESRLHHAHLRYPWDANLLAATVNFRTPNLDTEILVLDAHAVYPKVLPPIRPH